MTRTDHAVFDAAKAGDRAAFAAVVARTASTVYALLPPDGDRYRQLYDVYVRAMRDLSAGTQPQNLDAWLNELVAATKPRRERRNTWHSFSPETDLDVLWHELAVLFPSGRRLLRLSRPKTVIAAVLLAGLAGAALLVGTQTAQQSADTLRATVYQPDRPDSPQQDAETPPAPGDTPVVPVIPLPPRSADDPRPTPPPPAPSDDALPSEPDESDEPNGEPDVPPDDSPDDDTPAGEAPEQPAS